MTLAIMVARLSCGSGEVCLGSIVLLSDPYGVGAARDCAASATKRRDLCMLITRKSDVEASSRKTTEYTRFTRQCCLSEMMLGLGTLWWLGRKCLESRSEKRHGVQTCYTRHG